MSSPNSTGTTEYTTPSDTEIVMSRVFAAPRRLVFDVFTNPEHVPHWMIGPDGWTMTVCEIDLRPGGAWHFVWVHSGGEQLAMTGEYREVSPHERLVRTESWGGDWAESLCTLVLTEDGGRTRMTHTIAYPSKQARDAALATGMTDGSDRSFDRLAEYLRTMAG